jgi:hypothetical protein
VTALPNLRTYPRTHLITTLKGWPMATAEPHTHFGGFERATADGGVEVRYADAPAVAVDLAFNGWRQTVQPRQLDLTPPEPTDTKTAEPPRAEAPIPDGSGRRRSAATSPNT